MEASFHYVVKAKLIRFIKDDVIDFIEINEKFENANPIEAREKAFDVYQNHIDVLLQGINKIYVSDEQAREDLVSYVDSGMVIKGEGLFGDFEFSNSYGNGIGVYFVIDNPIEDKIFEDKIGDEYMIHGISYAGAGAQSLMDSLNHEFWYYDHFGYDFKNHKITVDFYEADADITEPNDILKTPFDWTGYDICVTSEEDEEDEDDETNEENSNFYRWNHFKVWKKKNRI
ncbi:hypothetical protein ACSVH2_08590 [Flavobacterium sp. RSB2_4_14]|uniref:hypothetical protein n=1 Tax=Flavobacterium sp. RSB2_4_14 TaxID=3447665 RepID=UPI003F32B60F